MFVRNYSVEPEGEKGCLLFANGARQNKVTVMKQKLICAGFLKLVSAIFYQIFVFSFIIYLFISNLFIVDNFR